MGLPYIRTNRGLVKSVIIFIVVLLILAYLGLNIRGIVASPTFRDNWSFMSETASTVWNSYLKRPANYIWNDVFVSFIWEPAIKNLTRMKDDGTGVVTPDVAPQLLMPQTQVQ